MAGIPVSNNLNAFNRMVNQTAGAKGSQTAPYANASYTKQEEALKDSFDMVMNRVNSQTGTTTDAQGESQTNVKAQTVAKTQTAAKTQTGAKSRKPQSRRRAKNLWKMSQRRWGLRRKR